jgi:hypothetical protein
LSDLISRICVYPLLILLPGASSQSLRKLFSDFFAGFGYPIQPSMNLFEFALDTLDEVC